MYLVQTVDYRDYTIKVLYDDDAPNPRNEFEHSSRFYNNLRRKTFEDGEHKFTEIVDEENHQLDWNFQQMFIYVPVYIYEHSGACVSTTPFCDPWDSGLFGMLAITKRKAMEDFGWKELTQKRIEKVKDMLRSEVKEYNQWLTGEVYAYTIEDVNGEEVDSCGGFYGDWQNINECCLLEVAQGQIDYFCKEANKQAETDRQAAEKESCEFWSGVNAA